ncbi:MAG TPA: hypothetical protein VGK67_07080 [Myxococcales bacterium]
MTSLNKLALFCCVSGLSLALTGCPGTTPSDDKPDTAVAPKVDAGVCTPTPCGDKKCGDDGCGTVCGVCGPGTACNKATWACDACTAELKADFCSRVAKTGKVCGSITDEDNCTRSTRTVDCGGCTNGKSCAADNTCTATCSWEGETAFCTSAGRNCGPYTGTDICGATKTVNCGTCTGGQDCVGGVCSGGANCGNGALDTGEACDGANLNAKTCLTEGFVGGTLTCNANCTVNVSNCTAGANCGNGAIDGTEQCDGTNLNAKTCLTQGFGSGTLTCNANCTLNTAACTGTNLCGNGALDTGEACDGTELNSKTCETEGYTGGTLTCSATCTLNTSACTGGSTPPNDTCATAIDITTATMPVTGRTTGGTDNSAGSCEGDYYYGGLQDGADVVYSFEITGTDPKTVEITVNRGAGSTYHQAVYVRSDCATTSSEKACAPYSSGGSTVKMKSLAPGKYYVIVDGEDGSAGDFQLTMTMSTPPPAPANDKCDSAGVGAMAITLDSATGHGEVTAQDSTDAVADTKGSCQSSYSTGNDLVYVVDTTGMGPRNITATVTLTRTTDNVSVYIRKVCDSADAANELACENPYDPVATAVATSLPEGKYYIWVDAYPGDEGPFSLTVDAVTPPANEKCGAAGADATDLAFAGDVATATSTTLGAADDYQGGCDSYSNPQNGADVVYKFTIPAGAANRSVTAVVTPDAAATSYRPAVYLWKACDPAATGNEVACAAASAAGGAATAQMLSAAPGTTYFAVVDGVARTAGAFTLTVTLGTEIILPDTCATAQPVALDGSGHGGAVGDTTTATNGGGGLCMSGTGGADLVYEVDTTGLGERNLTATVTFADTLANAHVYIRSVCDSTAAVDEKACKSTYDNVASTTAKRLPPGRYYVFVDSDSSDEGPFELVVDAVVPPTSPCLTATVIDVSSGAGSQPGSTLNTTNYTQGSCYGEMSNDSVFKFTTTAAQKVTVKVTPDVATSATYRPTLYVRPFDQCDSEVKVDELACVYTYTDGNPVEKVFNNLAAGSYAVWVDGYGSSTAYNGDFSVSVTLEAPLDIPEDCSSVKALDTSTLSNGNGVIAVSGDTTNANSDTNSLVGCGGGAGPDLVYSLTTTAEKDVKVQMVFSVTGNDALVYLRKGVCKTADPADQLGCDGTGTSSTFTAKRLPAGTYYLWADGYYASDKGAFTLIVTLSDPAPAPAGDTCATAIALTKGTSASGDTTNATADYGSTFGTACTSSDAIGADLVYSYTPSTAGDFTVTVTPASWDVLVWVSETTCGGSGADCIKSKDSSATGAETLTVTGGVAGTTYYIYVDSYNSSTGSFTIVVN